jgi:hypothetical protein
MTTNPSRSSPSGGMAIASKWLPRRHVAAVLESEKASDDL